MGSFKLIDSMCLSPTHTHSQSHPPRSPPPPPSLSTLLHSPLTHTHSSTHTPRIPPPLFTLPPTLSLPTTHTHPHTPCLHSLQPYPFPPPTHTHTPPVYTPSHPIPSHHPHTPCLHSHSPHTICRLTDALFSCHHCIVCMYVCVWRFMGPHTVTLTPHRPLAHIRYTLV